MKTNYLLQSEAIQSRNSRVAQTSNWLHDASFNVLLKKKNVFYNLKKKKKNIFTKYTFMRVAQVILVKVIGE